MEIETLICGGDASRRVACETLITAVSPPPTAEAPDLPFDSFEVPIGDDIDWGDLSAVYNRYDSIKGTANPKSNHHPNPRPRPGSHPHPPSLIGTVQHTVYAGRIPRPKKRSGRPGGRKPAQSGSEPGSPKVSCFGKVLSDRERHGERRRPATAEEGKGCWAGLVRLFTCGGGAGGEEADEGDKRVDRRPPAGKTAEPPRLGEMKRYRSGRKAASWRGVVDAAADEGGRGGGVVGGDGPGGALASPAAGGGDGGGGPGLGWR